MIYGIVCFATLFSFIGTVLGGIWADQSWGRFWAGTRRKTARSSSCCGTRSFCICAGRHHPRTRLINCAIFGNIVTAWSWFGVNMLGIGLHSYGFTEAAFKWLVFFVISQLAFIGLGLLPAKRWQSFKSRTV